MESGGGAIGELVGGNPWILLESGGGATGALVGGNPWALLESGGGATGALVGGNPWILLESGRGYRPSSRVVGTYFCKFFGCTVYVSTGIRVLSYFTQ